MHQISILYIGFVILIVGMVGMTMREKVDLVSKDYYEQEIKYQLKIDKINRTEKLKGTLTWEIKPGSIVITFPKELNRAIKSGSIYFFRPSDSEMDKTIDLTQDTLPFRNISTENIKKGLYKIEINWKADTQEYYNEGTIQIK